MLTRGQLQWYRVDAHGARPKELLGEVYLLKGERASVERLGDPGGAPSGGGGADAAAPPRRRRSSLVARAFGSGGGGAHADDAARPQLALTLRRGTGQPFRLVLAAPSAYERDAWARDLEACCAAGEAAGGARGGGGHASWDNIGRRHGLTYRIGRQAEELLATAPKVLSSLQASLNKTIIPTGNPRAPRCVPSGADPAVNSVNSVNSQLQPQTVFATAQKRCVTH